MAAVIQEAYVKGVSTRKVDDLVKALGMDGISKSEVSRVCKALDQDVSNFRNRPIERAVPYLWRDHLLQGERDRSGHILGDGGGGGRVRRRRALRAGSRLWAVRGPRLLDAVPTLAGQAWPQGCAARYL